MSTSTGAGVITSAPSSSSVAAAGAANISSMRQKVIRPAPSEIEYKNMRFLITDRPTDQNIQHYIQELKKHKVKDVVRVCEPTYKIEELRSEGIDVTDLAFEDGTSPPA
ncbi:hypothetical protein J437_LFUL005809, partial [Ladona fulva]